MDDLIKLLDGSVEDVKILIVGTSHDDLLKLRAAEQGGENREDVLAALDAALGEADAQRAGGVVQMVSDAEQARSGVDATALTTSGTGGVAIAADLDTSDRAEIPPATDIDTSGAPQQIVPDVNLNHPAVDNDPRAGTTDNMNRIDFNDPVRPGHEVVEAALKDQASA